MSNSKGKAFIESLGGIVACIAVDLGQIRTCAEDMAMMLYSDSRIPTKESLPLLLSALARDGGALGRLPDAYEREVLVYGGPVDPSKYPDRPDTMGEGSPELNALFPHVDKALSSFF